MQFGLSHLKSFVKEHKDRLIVVADKHTLADCYPLLDADLPHFIVPYGEGYKNLQSCEYIWKKMSDFGANRQSILLCLGGGVLSDLAAFAASCYMRGIPFALVPTSLLAMVDASVGGKNGVNFLGFKNFIGNFREADYTFICETFLQSLPQKEWIQGHVEMLKHGLIADKDHYATMRLFFLAKGEMSEELIRHSIQIKEAHVSKDFRDQGIRKRLNFGHTIGHAIEAYVLSQSKENEEWSHGTCVALGMIAESYLSHQLAGLSLEELNEIVIVLQGIVKRLDRPIPSFEAIQPYLLKDKKNDRKGVNFSLLTAIGSCKEDVVVQDTLIEEAMTYLHAVRWFVYRIQVSVW